MPVLPAEPSLNGVVDASWAAAATLHLDYDYTYQRAATEATTVSVAQDASGLDFAFVAAQREPITDRQTTNGANVLSDDYVEVYIYPNGTQGFAYSFAANPQGARYQTSSENTAYSPQWSAAGRITATGYVVTMHIPFNVIRSAGSTTWKVQVLRQTVATNGLAVWTHSPEEHTDNDAVFAGTLTDVDAQAHQRRTPARVQVYGLGELTTKAYGGDTSRVGLDASLPVTATSSFIATLHPDYSNVEIDQQTIAPTAFARQYAEVRPFFTQAASFYNSHMVCDNCPYTLYTPAIPTFGQGYAYEGTTGPLTYAAFDAIGDDRTDDAQALTYETTNPISRFHFDAQRVGVDLPGITDESTTLDGGYYDFPLHLGIYTNVGEDRQDGPFGPTSGGYSESGIAYTTPVTNVVVNIQNIGADYLPLDGYVAQNDIYGWEGAVLHTFNFSPSFVLHDISFSTYDGRYQDQFGRTDQTDSSSQVNFDFKDLLTMHAYLSLQGVGVPAYANDMGRYQLLPFDSSGMMIGYKFNTTTPTYIDYVGGPYYHGHLDAWSYITTVPLVSHLDLALEADSDRYLPDDAAERPTSQWLERASLDWQIDRYAEITVGVRRIVGANLPNAYQLPQWSGTTPCSVDPYLPGCSIDATNLSAAYHFLAARNEFYVVYGNPNDLTTLPALYVKWIRYIGAEKGT